MTYGVWQATVNFDNAVNTAGYDSVEAVQARTVCEEALTRLRSTEALDEAVERSSEPDAKCQGAFARFPNSVARDKRVTPALLVLLGLQSTFVDEKKPYGINEKRLLKAEIVTSGTGFGVRAIRSAIALGSKLGYITDRQQNGRRSRPGGFRFATERLTLPPCGLTGHAGRHLRREWFDGSLSLKEMAAFLFLRAGTGRGKSTYSRELAERFGWSPTTTLKVLKGLIELGLVAKQVSKNNLGKFQSTTYRTVSACLWANGSTHQLLSNGLPSNGKLSNTRNYPLHVLPSEEPLSRTLRGSYASRPNGEDAQTIDHSELLSEAFSSQNLLGWLEEQPIEGGFFDTDEDAIQAIIAVAGEDQLLGELKTAAGGRVSPEILSSEGIAVIRHIAAFILEQPPYEKSFEPHEALEYVLNAIHVRIGSQPGKWLNSLAVVGLRLLWSSAGGDAVEETPYRPGRDNRKPPSPKIADALSDIKKADAARAVSAKLYRHHAGLSKLLDEYGMVAVDTIRACLVSAAIDGGKVGRIKSWSFFIGALDDERDAAEREALGIRPGDCPGWRNAKVGKSHA